MADYVLGRSPSRVPAWLRRVAAFPTRYVAPLPPPPKVNRGDQFAYYVGASTVVSAVITSLGMAFIVSGNAAQITHGTNPWILAAGFAAMTCLSSFYIVQVVPGGSLWSPADFLILSSIFILGPAGVVCAALGSSVGYALRRKSSMWLSLNKLNSELINGIIVYAVFHSLNGGFGGAVLAGAVYEIVGQILVTLAMSFDKHESYGLEPLREVIFTVPFAMGYGWAALGASALFGPWGITGISMVAIPVILFQAFLVYMAHAVHMHNLEIERNHQERVELLQELVQKQRGFVADAAHELRTPLTTMSGSLEIMQEFPDIDLAMRERIVGDALTEARRLANLVDSLLELAALDSAEQAKHVQFDWEELVQQAATEAKERIGSEREFRVTVIGDLGTGFGDTKKLRRLIVLLADNVGAHTPAGSHATLAVERKDDDVVHISMEDDGPGVPAAMIDRTFERFVQVDPSRHDARPGMGLAIARSIASSHFGSIGARPVQPHGLRVVARIPSQEPQEAQEEKSAPSVAVLSTDRPERSERRESGEEVSPPPKHAMNA